jgi:hypothetical protein
MTTIHQLDLIPRYLAIVRTLEYGSPSAVRRTLENGVINLLNKDLISCFDYRDTPEGKIFWRNIDTNSPDIVDNTLREHYPNLTYKDRILPDANEREYGSNDSLVRDLPTLIRILAHVRQLEQGSFPCEDISLKTSASGGNFDWDETREGYKSWGNYFHTLDPRYIYHTFLPVDPLAEPIKEENEKSMLLNRENAHEVKELTVCGDKMQIKALADMLANYYACDKEPGFEQNWHDNNDRHFLAIFIHRYQVNLMMMSCESGTKYNLPNDWDQIISDVESHRQDPMEFYKAKGYVPEINKDDLSVQWGCYKIFYDQLNFLSDLTQHCDIEMDFNDTTIDNVMINNLMDLLERQKGD